MPVLHIPAQQKGAFTLEFAIEQESLAMVAKDMI
jgi:hypothetical protein